MTDAPAPAPKKSAVFLCFDGVERRLEALKTVLSSGYSDAEYLTADSVDELKLMLDNVRPSICFADLGTAPQDVETLLRLVASDHADVEVLILTRSSEGAGDLPDGCTDYILYRDDAAGQEELLRRVGCALRRRTLRMAHQKRLRDQALSRLIRDMHGSLSRINHELNNPLAIISGNAQLFLELADIEGLSAEFVDPVRDIEEAAQRLATSIRKLVELRDALVPSPPPRG